MPRIPQATFDTAPSMDVPSARIQQIEPVAATAMKRIGSEAIQISKAWEQVNMKADALSGVGQAEAEVDQFQDRFQELVNDSVRGKLSDGRELSAVVSQELDALRTKHSATLASNPTAAEMYNQIAMPKVQNMYDKALSVQKAQIHDGVVEDLSSSLSTIVNKSLTQDITEEEKNGFRLKAINAVGVIDREKSLKFVGLLDKQLAMAAPKRMEYEGWSPELEKKIRSQVASSNLTEGERAVAEFSVERAIKIGQNVAREKANREHGEFIKSVGLDYSKYIQVRENAYQVLSTYSNTALAPYETQEERDTKVADVASMIIVNEVAGKHGGVLFGRGAEGDAAKLEEVYKDISEAKARVMGERMPAGASLDDAIASKVSMLRSKIQKRGGAMAVFTSFDPMYAADMNSGDSGRVNAAITRAMDWYDKNDVPTYNRTLMTLAEAESIGKMFKEIAKGDADPTGGQAWGFLRQQLAKYGEHASIAFQDLVTFGKGTAAGEPNVPPLTTLAPFIVDDLDGQELFAAYNRREDLAKEISGFKPKDLDQAIMKYTDSPHIGQARVGANDALSQGYRQAVDVYARQYLRDKADTKPDYAEAVKFAEEKLRKSVMTIRRGDSGAIMLPTKEMVQRELEEGDIKNAMDRVSSFSGIESLGNTIDWDAMSPSITGTGTALSAAISRIKAETDPATRAKLADSLLGRHLMIVNDNENTKGASFYIKTYDSAPIPLVTMKDGKPHQVKIDLFDAAENTKSKIEEIDSMTNSKRAYPEKAYGKARLGGQIWDL